MLEFEVITTCEGKYEPKGGEMDCWRIRCVKIESRDLGEALGYKSGFQLVCLSEVVTFHVVYPSAADNIGVRRFLN